MKYYPKNVGILFTGRLFCRYDMDFIPFACKIISLQRKGTFCSTRRRTVKNAIYNFHNIFSSLSTLVFPKFPFDESKYIRWRKTKDFMHLYIIIVYVRA